MTNKLNKQFLRCLDVFVSKLLKQSALIQGAGFFNGKTGIAVLLYYYARYKQNIKISEYADMLTDIILDEISLYAGFNFERGICGTAWAINQLITFDFIQADEDVFEVIDDQLFKEIEKTFSLEKFNEESWKGIYILGRLHSSNHKTEKIWRQRTVKYLQHICQLLKLQNNMDSVYILTCKDLLPVFHVCSVLWNNDRYATEVNSLCKELPVITEMALKKEKNYGDKYMSYQLLSQLPFFNGLLEIDVPKSVALMDVIQFYLNRWIVESDIPAPKIISDALLNIVKDKKRIDEWLFLLNPDNAGLGNYAGGLTWAMLQVCMEEYKHPESL